MTQRDPYLTYSVSWNVLCKGTANANVSVSENSHYLYVWLCLERLSISSEKMTKIVRVNSGTSVAMTHTGLIDSVSNDFRRLMRMDSKYMLQSCGKKN